MQNKRQFNLHWYLYLFFNLMIYNMLNTPCNQKLTDIEYINHMITHHEVAVYMSENQLPITKNPKLLDILINVIRIQNYEINLMKDSKIVDTTNNNLNDAMSNKNIKMYKSYRYTQGYLQSII